MLVPVETPGADPSPSAATCDVFARCGLPRDATDDASGTELSRSGLNTSSAVTDEPAPRTS